MAELSVISAGCPTGETMTAGAAAGTAAPAGESAIFAGRDAMSGRKGPRPSLIQVNYLCSYLCSRVLLLRTGLTSKSGWTCKAKPHIPYSSNGSPSTCMPSMRPVMWSTRPL